MFIEREELFSAIGEYQLDSITTSSANIRWAIEAATGEARAYLNKKYDCAQVFAARGDERNATLVENIKNLAVWYLVRRCNTDIIFEYVKHYRQAAIDWLEKISGIDADRDITDPDLPLKG